MGAAVLDAVGVEHIGPRRIGSLDEAFKRVLHGADAVFSRTEEEIGSTDGRDHAGEFVSVSGGICVYY